MKKRKIWALILTAFLIVNTFSASAQEMSKQDYLDKSRTQKTTAFILLGSSAAMIGTGIYLYNFQDGYIDVLVLYSVGFWTWVASIPFFVSSSKNAKKAAQLGFRNEPIHMPKYASNLSRSVPSITLKIPL